MKNVFIFLFCLQQAVVLAQTDVEIYKFSEDTLREIENDSTSWKYQVGATKLSFSGYYPSVLSAWDQNGFRKPQPSQKDSLYFTNSKKVNAKTHIIEQAKNAQLVIINEAHHVAKHRTFIQSLLKELYKNGYRYLGLETLTDAAINERKYAVTESGYYVKEPEFGNLIAEALQLGFILFAYEASEGKNGKEREIEQAQNIQKFIENNPAGKVLIHCGYAHVYENDFPYWGKAMAGRLKDNMQIDPLTIDQTLFLERADKTNNHLFMKLNNTNEPLVLIDEKNQVFNGNDIINQTDIVVIHPETQYINNRPNWLIRNKKRHKISSSKIKNNESFLVLAYRNNEHENQGVPSDIIEITDSNPSKELFLTKGIYTIVVKNRNYEIVDQYKVKI
ncbi:hypothetical protein K5I29_02990 [Flavobacterium agricola]|uniref:Erythromycin esterase n=1 Tax=Flavobacterium agricola TaxID=2870839 RepID=A0ABY6M017_9FLAO|nr:hypothetical protein [Flavobacterium agricola]UYW01897.1 hypothetical protein K5I29_02990 [Flavobacterium agricola]